MKPPDLATIAAHVAALAKTFSTTPATVRKWIKLHGMSPMPSAYIVASAIWQSRKGRRAATLKAAMREVSRCKEPWKEGYLEGLKRNLPPLQAREKPDSSRPSPA